MKRFRLSSLVLLGVALAVASITDLRPILAEKGTPALIDINPVDGNDPNTVLLFRPETTDYTVNTLMVGVCATVRSAARQRPGS
jgi:hypothetical protein